LASLEVRTGLGDELVQFARLQVGGDLLVPEIGVVLEKPRAEFRKRFGR
jgi:hypothetical protein